MYTNNDKQEIANNKQVSQQLPIPQASSMLQIGLQAGGIAGIALIAKKTFFLNFLLGAGTFFAGLLLFLLFKEGKYWFIAFALLFFPGIIALVVVQTYIRTFKKLFESITNLLKCILETARATIGATVDNIQSVYSENLNMVNEASLPKVSDIITKILNDSVQPTLQNVFEKRLPSFMRAMFVGKLIKIITSTAKLLGERADEMIAKQASSLKDSSFAVAQSSSITTIKDKCSLVSEKLTIYTNKVDAVLFRINDSTGDFLKKNLNRVLFPARFIRIAIIVFAILPSFAIFILSPGKEQDEASAIYEMPVSEAESMDISSEATTP